MNRDESVVQCCRLRKEICFGFKYNYNCMRASRFYCYFLQPGLTESHAVIVIHIECLVNHGCNL